MELVLNEDHYRRIVLEGICRARVSIAIMTADFKSMRVPTGMGKRGARSIVQILRDKACQGVEIRILHGGVPSRAALSDLKVKLPQGFTIRRCPRLHSKAVIIDAKGMYLGSANLTGAGLGAKSPGRRNFELGIWTEDPGLIEPVMDEFDALWEARECATCQRRDVCPVPLEEPDR
ncbi:MAG: hypothetical protein KatS3mg104_0406 [Phycisphaerae bacterium]|nr:MAG: hypothetical protein KatS3mg104_0406 [Phycisphaerae bacterium]